MFEVFNSVQIKPFCLKVGIINKKILLSESPHFLSDMPRFAAFCKTCHKTAKVDRFPGLQNGQIPRSLWFTLVKIRR